jgi:hypothetical protein
VSGEIADHPIAAAHDQMTAPEALAVIGPVLAALLHTGGENVSDTSGPA